MIPKLKKTKYAIGDIVFDGYAAEKGTIKPLQIIGICHLTSHNNRTLHNSIKETAVYTTMPIKYEHGEFVTILDTGSWAEENVETLLTYEEASKIIEEYGKTKKEYNDFIINELRKVYPNVINPENTNA